MQAAVSVASVSGGEGGIAVILKLYDEKFGLNKKKVVRMNYAELARQQNNATTSILETSLLDAECIQELTKSYCFVSDISACAHSIRNCRESKLFNHALKEFQFGLFALNQGFYRHAFSALRLSFEMSLSAIEFSANEFSLRQWERGCHDINWGRITNVDTGIFSANFLRAFCSGVAERGPHFKSISEKVYRECSEYVHGNAVTHNLLPDDFKFSKECILLWCEKALTIHMIVLFAFFSRYLQEMKEADRKEIELPFLETLGHIKEVRITFGAAV